MKSTADLARAAAARRIHRAELAVADALRDLDAACAMDDSAAALLALPRHGLRVDAEALRRTAELFPEVPEQLHGPRADVGPVEVARLLVRVLGDGGAFLALDFTSVCAEAAAVNVDFPGGDHFRLIVSRRQP